MLSMYHTLYFESTRKCNFSCEHCSSGSNGNYEIEPDIDYNTIVERILVPAYSLGTRFIGFSGGEFLLRKDAYELLEVANKIGFNIGIVSNGSTINKKVIHELKQILGDNFLITLGINSFDEENKKTRNVESSYFLKVLDLLESENVRCNIAVTMGSFNADSFNDTVEKIRKRYLPFNRIPFVPRHSSQTCMMFNKEIMRDKLHPALIKSFHGYISYVPLFLNPEDYEKHSEQNIENNHIPTNPSVGCWCGSFYSISPAGEVSPCPLIGDHVSGGNVLTENLKDILFKSKLFTGITDRNNLKGKCGSCHFKFTCGGCRAYSYYVSGDIYAEDPTCFIDELNESEIENLTKETYKNFKNYLKMARFGGHFKKSNQI